MSDAGIAMTPEERDLLAPFPEEVRAELLEDLRDPASGLRGLLRHPNPRVRRVARFLPTATTPELEFVLLVLDRTRSARRN